MKKYLAALAILATLGTAQADTQARLDRVELDSAKITAGQTLEGRIVLEEAARDQDTWVELRGSDGIHTPQAVRVPMGQKEVTFQVLTNPVEGTETATILAGVNGSYQESGQLVLMGQLHSAQR